MNFWSRFSTFLLQTCYKVLTSDLFDIALLMVNLHETSEKYTAPVSVEIFGTWTPNIQVESLESGQWWCLGKQLRKMYLTEPWMYNCEELTTYSVLLKTFVIRQLCSSFRENQETTWFRVIKLIFVKCLIERNPLNHYMLFKLNDLKVLEH